MFDSFGNPDLPQLLFIHGGGVGAWMWNDVIEKLSPYFNCIVVTLPYHGADTPSIGPFTIESYTELLLNKLKLQRNDQPIGVVGFSLGAQIALQLISLSPHLFRFAMINSALCTNTGIPSSLLIMMIRLSMPLSRLKSFAKLQAKTLYIPDTLFNTYYSLTKMITTNQLLEIISTNMSYRLASSLSETSTSVHITYGDKENRPIKNSAREITHVLPLATIYVVPKLGHGFPLAEPIIFANYIKNNF